jgi:DNA-binding CsgD family transcriptional regulator
VTNYSKVPWVKVHDYLLTVGSCRTVRDFAMAACREVEKLIPYDTTACMHLLAGRTYFDVCLASACRSVATAEYNTYYRMRQPGVPGVGGKHSEQALGLLMSSHVVDWRKLQYLEYATDFMLPYRMCKSLTHVIPAQQVALSVHRSRSSPDFKDADATVLGVLNQHLNTYWPLLVEREKAKPSTAREESGLYSDLQGAVRPGLTQRETEIALLLSERLSMPEIAGRLFISRRTVEKHAERIYAKLGVRKKAEVGDHLRSLERPQYLFRSS